MQHQYSKYNIAVVKIPTLKPLDPTVGVSRRYTDHHQGQGHP